MKFTYLIALLAAISLAQARASVKWTMLNVNETHLQADAHLIEWPSGKWVLIDCGDPKGSLVEMLKKRKIRELEMVLVSHVHLDHFGGMAAILDSGIRVKSVYVNVPPKKVCDSEIPWGCKWEEVQKFLNAVKQKGVPLKTYTKGETLLQEGEARLRVLSFYNGENTPIGETQVNDTSVLLMLEQGNTRALFTGDLAERMGAYLAKNLSDLKADILKVPHHGGKLLAPNEFFDVVAPVVALVPAPAWLWKHERTERTRAYLHRKDIPTYVNGIDGEIEVTLNDEGFRVSLGQKKKYPLLWSSRLFGK